MVDIRFILMYCYLLKSFRKESSFEYPQNEYKTQLYCYENKNHTSYVHIMIGSQSVKQSSVIQTQAKCHSDAQVHQRIQHHRTR